MGGTRLLVGLIRGWQRRDRIAGWTVAGLGLAASVAGNVGQAASGNWTVSLTAAVPPPAAAASLAVGFGVFKRVAAAPAARALISAPSAARAAAPAWRR